MFVVKKISAEYHASAKLDDELKVETKLSELSGAKILFDQSVYKGTILLFSSLVTVVFISDKGRPVRMPIEIAEKLKQFAA